MSPDSTHRAARKYAGEVPGRGPIVPARCRTAAIAVAARTASGSARGSGVGAGDVGVVDGARVGAEPDAEAEPEAVVVGADERGAGSSVVHAVSSKPVATATTTEPLTCSTLPTI